MAPTIRFRKVYLFFGYECYPYRMYLINLALLFQKLAGETIRIPRRRSAE